MMGKRSTNIFRNGFGQVLVLLLLASYSAGDMSKFEIASMDKRFTAGKDQMDKIQSIMTMSKLPKHGKCWKSVLRDLQTACSLLTEEIQSKLAFAFTSCFNEMLGLPPYMCEPSTPIKECVRNLDATGMNTFRDYFLHTQDMCFYIQHEIWQEETDKAVNELTNVANVVTKNIQDTQSAQEKILTSQQESLKVQSNLMKDNNALYNAVVRVKEVFDDFKHSADEHRLIFLEIFEKLSKMQTLVSWIQGEMSLLDTMGFYFACLVFGILSTTTRRTRRARFYIIILLVLCLGMERSVFSYLSGLDDPVVPEDIQLYVWYIRRSAAILGIVILVVTAANYRDIQVMNSNMLLEMNTQMHQLMKFVNEIQRISATGLPIGPLLPMRCTNDEDDEASSDCSDSFSNYSSDEDFEVHDLETRRFCKNILSGIENVPQEGSSSEDSESPGKYNLRARKPLIPNPVVASEDPHQFAKAVNVSLNRSQNHSRSAMNYY